MSQRHDQRSTDRDQDVDALDGQLAPGKLTQLAHQRADGEAPGVGTTALTSARGIDIASIRGALRSLDGGGTPLPPEIADHYGNLLGADLSDVRVHANNAAAADIGAQAFAHGTDVALGPNIDLATDAGHHVLGHELVHVAQNMGGGGAGGGTEDVGPSGSLIESEAEAGAAAVTSNQPFRAGSHSNLPAISRFDGPLPSGTPNKPNTASGPTPQPKPAPTPSPKAPAASPTPATAGTPTAPSGPSPAKIQAAPTPDLSTTTAPPAPRSTAAPQLPTLDARLRELFEQRADPTLKAGYNKATTQIDLLRIQAVQFAFSPTRMGPVIMESLLPWETIKQHGREISLTNPYDPGSLLAWIDGARATMRVIGDVASCVSTLADVVAGVSALLAVISSWTGVGAVAFGGIAVIAGEVGAIAGLIKIVLDMIDALVSIIQMVLLIRKIKASKDPSQRAKMAALIGREIQEFASTTAGVVVQVGTIVATAGAAAGVSSLFSKSAKAFVREFGEELRGEFRPLLNARESVHAIGEAAEHIKAGKVRTIPRAEITPQQIADGAITVQRIEVRRVKVKSRLSRAKRKNKPTQWREVTEVTERRVRRTADLPKDVKPTKNTRVELVYRLDVTKVNPGAPNQPIAIYIKQQKAIGLGLGSGNVQASAKETVPTTPSERNQFEPSTGGGNSQRAPSKVAMWPSQFAQLQQSRGQLPPANDRMMTQYNIAKREAGTTNAAALERVFGAVRTNAGHMRFAALQQQTAAVDGVAESDKGAKAASEGKQRQSQLTNKTSAIERSVATVGGTKVEKPEPKQDGSWWDKAKNWVYDNTIGKLGAAVGSLQSWVAKTVGSWAIAKAGLTKEELDMAGIEDSMRADSQKDKKTEAEMKAAQAEAAKIDPALAEVMKGANREQQAALQAMFDAQQLATALDMAQAELDRSLADGAAYMTAVAPLLQRELDTQHGGKTIDAAYIAPLIGGANALKASAPDGGELADGAAADAQRELAAAKAAWPELNINPGLANIAQAKQAFVSAHGGLARDAQQAADRVIAAARAAVGTGNYDAVTAASHELALAVDAFTSSEDQFVDRYLADLDAIIDGHLALIENALIVEEVDPKTPASEPAPVQRRATGGPVADGDPTTIAAQGLTGPTTALPHRDAIAAAFGRHDVSGIQAHVGGDASAAAEALGAMAYATGNSVAFASSPDLFTAAHEAAHVIQQKDGVSLRGLDGGKSDAHERHADAVAAAVVSGQSAEPLLDHKPGSEPPELKKVTPRLPINKQATPVASPDAQQPTVAGPKTDAKQVKPGAPPSPQPVDRSEPAVNAAKPAAAPEAAATEAAATKDEAPAPKPPKAPLAPRSVAPAEAASQPIAAAVAPLQLEAPRATKQIAERWVRETGRDPAAHHAQITAALGELTSDIETKQRELGDVAQAAAVQVSQQVADRVASFRSSTVALGRQRVAAAFTGMDKVLDDGEKKAIADIAVAKKAGEAQIKAAHAAKSAELAAKFQQARAGNADLVTKYAPAAASALKKFAATVKPLVDHAKAEAVKVTTTAAEAYDPKQFDGTTSFAGGLQSLQADIYRNHTLALGKKLGKQYEAKLTGVAKDIDKSALKITQQALDPPKQELDITLDVVSKTSSRNLEGASKQATQQLTANEQTATKAVHAAKQGARKKYELEQTTALTAADRAGQTLTDDASAAAKDLTAHIAKRASDDARGYQLFAAEVQRGVRIGAPHKFEQLAPKIADAKQRLATMHAATLDGLREMIAAGTRDLTTTFDKQQATYNAAIGEQEAVAKRVQATIVSDLARAATDTTTSQTTLTTGFDSAAGKEIAKLDGAVANFNAQSAAAFADFEHKVTAKLEQTKVGLDKELAVSLEPASIKQDVDADAKAELKRKQVSVAKDASALRDAMDGWGTDEAAIYRTLRKLGWGEIEYLEAAYNEHYASRAKNGMTPLRFDLADELNDSELAIATAYLNHDRQTAIRLELADSLGFWNDDEARIEEVLRSCSEEEITHLNTNPTAKATVAKVKKALGGSDLEVVNALLDQSFAVEQRVAKANAIRLYDAMDTFWGTDEDKIKQLLEEAATPEDRQRLRQAFNEYAKSKPIAYLEGWAGGSGAEGDDMLDRALASELSGGELMVAKALAKTERDEQEVKMAKIVEGAEGVGTNEDQIFDALDDPDYAEKWKALKEAGDTEGLKRLEAERIAKLDAKLAALGSKEGIQALLDGEMEKSYLTWEEFTSGTRKDGKPVTDQDRKFLMDIGSGYLEWMVAQRKLQTGQADPELALAYAMWGVAGTHEELINKVLSRGGEPMPIGELKAIAARFEAVWQRKLVDRWEIDDPENMKFPDPGGELSAELGGKDWNKTRVLLCGQPTTPVELRYVRKLQMKYATSGVLGGVLMDIGEAIGFTEAKSTMKATEQQFDAKYEQLRAQYGKDLSTMKIAELGEKGEELERFGAYLEQDVEAYNRALNSIVDTVVTVLEIVGGVIVTVVTAGAASPALAAVIGNLIVSAGAIAFKWSALGDQYGAGDLAKDIVQGAINAGMAGMADVKALAKLSDTAAKKTSGVLFKAVNEGVNAGGGRLIGTSIELGPKGIKTVEKIVSAGVRNLAISSTQEVATFLTDEQTYSMKLGEALWGPNSIGARLAKNAPKAFVEGTVKQWIDDAASVNTKWNRGRLTSAGANMIGNALSDAGSNIAGFFFYLDNYNDAQEFWDRLLKSTGQRMATGFLQGYGMHKMRAKRAARDFLNDDMTVADLADMLTYMEAREIRELALFVQKLDPAKFAQLPDTYKQAASGGPAQTALRADGTPPRPGNFDAGTETEIAGSKHKKAGVELDDTLAPAQRHAPLREDIEPRPNATEDGARPRRQEDEARRAAQQQAEQQQKIKQEADHAEHAAKPPGTPHVANGGDERVRAINGDHQVLFTSPPVEGQLYTFKSVSDNLYIGRYLGSDADGVISLQTAQGVVRLNPGRLVSARPGVSAPQLHNFGPQDVITLYSVRGNARTGVIEGYDEHGNVIFNGDRGRETLAIDQLNLARTQRAQPVAPPAPPTPQAAQRHPLADYGPDDVITLYSVRGNARTGTILSIDADGNVTFKSERGVETLRLDQLNLARTERVAARTPVATDEAARSALPIIHAGAEPEAHLQLAQRLGVMPNEAIVVDNAVFRIGQPFEVGEGRVGALIEVEVDGKRYLRVAYQSNSQGGFRILPARNKVGFVPGYDKAIGEHAIMLPNAVDEALARHTTANNIRRNLSKEQREALFEGAVPVNRTFEDYAAYDKSPDHIKNSVQEAQILAKPKTMLETSGGHELPAPDQVRISAETQRPNFHELVRSYTVHTAVAGEVTALVFHSRDRNLEYVLYQDNAGRVWFKSVSLVHSAITPQGVRAVAIDADALCTPLWEYHQQIPQGYAGVTNPDHPSYANAWKYLRQFPEIRAYYEATGRAMPGEESAFARNIAGVKPEIPEDRGRDADGKPKLTSKSMSLDGRPVEVDIREVSPEARHIIRQIDEQGWVRVDSVSPKDLVDVSKWYGREVAVVQSPFGRLRVVLGTEDGVLAKHIAPGEVFVVHTHPVFSSDKSHFRVDLDKAGKRVEAVIDWSGQITYFSKAGIKNPISETGRVEPLLGYRAAFIDDKGHVAGYADIDIIDGPAGTKVKVVAPGSSERAITTDDPVAAAAKSSKPTSDGGEETAVAKTKSNKPYLIDDGDAVAMKKPPGSGDHLEDKLEEAHAEAQQRNKPIKFTFNTETFVIRPDADVTAIVVDYVHGDAIRTWHPNLKFAPIKRGRILEITPGDETALNQVAKQFATYNIQLRTAAISYEGGEVSGGALMLSSQALTAGAPTWRELHALRLLEADANGGDWAGSVTADKAAGGRVAPEVRSRHATRHIGLGADVETIAFSATVPEIETINGALAELHATKQPNQPLNDKAVAEVTRFVEASRARLKSQSLVLEASLDAVINDRVVIADGAAVVSLAGRTVRIPVPAGTDLASVSSRLQAMLERTRQLEIEVARISGKVAVDLAGASDAAATAREIADGRAVAGPTDPPAALGTKIIPMRRNDWELDVPDHKVPPERREAARAKYGELIERLERETSIEMPTGAASVDMMAGITLVTGKEVGLYRVEGEDGKTKRVLTLGDYHSVPLPSEKPIKLIAHTHPRGGLIFSNGDTDLFRRLDQDSSVLISPAGRAIRQSVKIEQSHMSRSAEYDAVHERMAWHDDPAKRVITGEEVARQAMKLRGEAAVPLTDLVLGQRMVGGPGRPFDVPVGVASARVDQAADLALIQQGKAQLGPPLPGGGRTFEINGRVYGEHYGKVFPLRGAGIFELNGRVAAVYRVYRDHYETDPKYVAETIRDQFKFLLPEQIKVAEKAYFAERGITLWSRVRDAVADWFAPRQQQQASRPPKPRSEANELNEEADEMASTEPTQETRDRPK